MVSMRSSHRGMLNVACIAYRQVTQPTPATTRNYWPAFGWGSRVIYTTTKKLHLTYSYFLFHLRYSGLTIMYWTMPLARWVYFAFSFNANLFRLSFLCLTVGETCGIIQEVVVSCGWTFLRIFLAIIWFQRMSGLLLLKLLLLWAEPKLLIILFSSVYQVLLKFAMTFMWSLTPAGHLNTLNFLLVIVCQSR